MTFCSAAALLVGGYTACRCSDPVSARGRPSDGRQIARGTAELRIRFGALLAALLLLSLVVHLIQAWMHVVMGRALGLEIPFPSVIILYPLVGTFAAIPISFNGIGLREGGLSFIC